jgi:arginyl-tRNA synthetase
MSIKIQKILDPFTLNCLDFLNKALKEVSKDTPLPEDGLSSDKLLATLSTPPNSELGHRAFACFPLAKVLKKAPPLIAKEVSDTFQKKEKKDFPFIRHVEAVNGYINFFCDTKTLFNHMFKASHALAPFSKAHETVMVEYSQPNTHKALHVGHLRGLVLGDAASRILDFAGLDVVRATYPGDNGTHIAKLIWYLCHQKNGEKDLPIHEPSTLERSKWLGNMYAHSEKSYKEALEQDEKGTRKLLAYILEEISSHSSHTPYYKIWAETRQWSLDTLEELYRIFQTQFDVWYFESECERPSVELAKRKLEEGAFVLDQGAIGIDLSSYNLGFAMYLKSDGHSLYITKDLELVEQRLTDKRFHLDKIIYVVDSRQKFHFRQLFKTVELLNMGKEEQYHHLAYETINTEDGKPFSSRELNGLGIFDLIDKMTTLVKEDYLHKYKDTWTKEDIEKTALKITLGALKYGILRVDNNTQVTFSLKEWLRLDGDTGPYLQYVHSRCLGILRKFEITSSLNEIALSHMEEPTSYEEELIMHLNDFKSQVFQAAVNLRPSTLAQYLFLLSKIFNRFYENCSIKDAKTPELQNFRLSLVSHTKETIAKGLELLCIPLPEHM